MSNEMLHKTAENALTIAETYEDYLLARARRLTGENSRTPTSLGDMAINLFVAGALGTPHISDPTHEVAPSFQVMSEHTARQAVGVLETANWMDRSKNPSRT